MVIKFKDLSIPLKILVAFGWITLIFFSSAFILGYVGGFLGLI